MKTRYILLMLTLTIGLASVSYGQSSNKNYTRIRTYTNEAGTTYRDDIQYYDGLGRPNQAVMSKASPLSKDVVSLQEYDAYGRESYTWLPAVMSVGTGAYVAPTTIKSSAVSSNGGDPNPYSYRTYEASPLNRTLSQFGPGQQWQNNNKAVNIEYFTNVQNDPVLGCEVFTEEAASWTPSGGDFRIRNNGKAATGTFRVVKTTDEDGNSSYEFQDKMGRTILIRQYDGSKYLDTHYYYDREGNIRYVLPPAASAMIQTNGSVIPTDAMEYVYIYFHDMYRRCWGKKLPGAHWVLMVYDKADRLVMTQDGNQRSSNRWLYTEYDNLDRVVSQRIISGTPSRNTIQNNYDNAPTSTPYNPLASGQGFSTVAVLVENTYGE